MFQKFSSKIQSMVVKNISFFWHEILHLFANSLIFVNKRFMKVRRFFSQQQ